MHFDYQKTLGIHRGTRMKKMITKIFMFNSWREIFLDILNIFHFHRPVIFTDNSSIWFLSIKNLAKIAKCLRLNSSAEDCFLDFDIPSIWAIWFYRSQCLSVCPSVCVSLHPPPPSLNQEPAKGHLLKITEYYFVLALTI